MVEKAATGLGVGFWNTGVPLDSVQRTPQMMMKRAQLAYHVNPWVKLAEATITRKVVGMPWHLEDAQDEEYPDDTAGDVAEARLLLERPQFLLGDPKPGTATRRLMMGLTTRHVGLCGMSYWYGDQMSVRGVPLAWLYINPARMWPSEDEQGNLTGWVLDAQDQTGRGGTPLSTEEVLPFYLDPPDWGHLGTGWYEGVVLKSQITNLGDQHAAYVIGTGGRIAGIVSPKEGSIPDEKFKALVSEFRNVNEAPDAAKRTTILQGPVDFTPTAANPQELNLVDLSKMNRDDILAEAGVPPSQASIPIPAGLNSGATKGFDEAILMQGAVHDRVVAIRETLQYGFLDKYLPTVIELEFEEPEFDDKSPAFALMTASREVALTNAERRELGGYPPTGDPAIDNAILLPSTSTLWATAPEEGQTQGAIEEIAPPVAPVVIPADQTVGKAKELLGLRRAVDTRMVPALRKSVRSALNAQKTEIVSKVRAKGAHLQSRPTDQRIWWNEDKEKERLIQAIRPHLAALSQTVTKRASEVLDTPKKADNFAERVEQFVLRRAGERIVDMLRTTRDAIQTAISQGFNDGLAPGEVADLLEQSTTFDEARAELVARTETALAYNDAALNSYTEFGVDMVEPIDGDQDEECIARLERGPVTIEEALADTDHPNGTLDWVPYFGKSSVWTPRVEIPQVQRDPVTVNVQPPVMPRPPMQLVFERNEYGKIASIREVPL